jgi:hypothetical protein
MPEKIRSIDDKAGQSLFDLIFLPGKTGKALFGLTDAEAKTLYDLWKNAPVGAKKFAINDDMDRSQITSLKTKGYLTGFGNGIELTSKGKKVIVEMVTHESNAFEKRASELSYSKIKANANRRPRQSLLRKKASKEVKDKVFNLRKASILRMSKIEDRDNESDRKAG